MGTAWDKPRGSTTVQYPFIRDDGLRDTHEDYELEQKLSESSEIDVVITGSEDGEEDGDQIRSEAEEEGGDEKEVSGSEDGEVAESTGLDEGKRGESSRVRVRVVSIKCFTPLDSESSVL